VTDKLSNLIYVKLMVVHAARPWSTYLTALDISAEECYTLGVLVDRNSPEKTVSIRLSSVSIYHIQ
jgi:hypothetical protein